MKSYQKLRSNPVREFWERVIAPGLTALIFISIVAVCLTAMPIQASDSAEKQWKFRVYLDDKKIGHHTFSVESSGDLRTLRSEADFEYKLLFVKLYEYEHQNTETWQGDCLASIRSETDANGKPFYVRGELKDEQFSIEGTAGTEVLPPCIMSFAYWDADMLNQSRLLNTQNGEYLDIQVGSPVPVELEIRGKSVQALQYQLTAKELSMNLWYSIDKEWLGLESEARGGRVLRYELI